MKFPAYLGDLAEDAVRACVNNTTSVLGTDEVAEVARLALELPAQLAAKWSSRLVAGSLAVGGVFCHKTPQAVWTDPFRNEQRPELGDLLIVVAIAANKKVVKRAPLVQAKVAKIGTFSEFEVAKGSSSAQRHMYAEWPDFDLTGKEIPGLKGVNISPKIPSQCLGSRYASVCESAPPPLSGWYLEGFQAAPLKPLSKIDDYARSYLASEPLGFGLLRMLNRQLGADLNRNSEWKRLVEHLVNLSTKRTTIGKVPPDTKSAGGMLPHIAATSLFVAAHHSQGLVNKRGLWREQSKVFEVFDSAEPPKLEIEESRRGFGIIYIQLRSPQWE